MSTSPDNLPGSSAPAIPAPAGYIDRAYQALANLGLVPAKENDHAAVLAIVADVSSVDETRALLIARTLQAEGTFNSVVRDQIQATKVGESYERIAKSFDTVIADARAMLVQANTEGKATLGQKFSNLTMKLTRGSIHDRFMKIRRDFDDVSKRTGDALAREKAVIGAYLDYRGALKQAETAAYGMLALQEKNLADARAAYQAKVTAVDAAPEGEVRANAQLARDESKTAFDDAQRRFDRIKKLADNLKVAYSVGEAVVARLSQGHAVKENVYDQAVTFFSTNESSFTALDATLTQTAGLHEVTEATKALERGTEKALEAVAEVGTSVQEAGLHVAYGATVRAESVKKLIDAVVEFQAKSIQIAAEERAKATENANLMEKYVDDGKRRFSELVAAAPLART